MTIVEIPGVPNAQFTAAVMPNDRIVLTGTVERQHLPDLIKWLEIQSHPECSYTQAHTQYFCGNPRCRAS